MTIVMDKWINEAMADDSVVADLLCIMKHSREKLKPKLRPPSLLPPPPPLHSTASSWGARKPRTRPMYASRPAAAVPAKKRAYKGILMVDSTRCSPTTPLSWNGTDSPSATADGADDSTARSKGIATCDSASTKKCKKKKTFAELQEEESFLIKERIYLTKEIENITASYQAEKARNESLKRIKLDLGSIPNKQPDSTPAELLTTNSDQTQQTVVPSAALIGAVENVTCSQPADSVPAMTESSSKSFLLPDLNMTPPPPEDYLRADVQSGAS